MKGPWFAALSRRLNLPDSWVAKKVESMNGSKSISPDALEHLVYVIGSARGGTTVLREALGIHDQILMLPGMTHFMNQVWRYRRRIHQRLLNQVFRLPGFYREDYVLRCLGDKERKDLERVISGALVSRDLKRMWQLYPLVYSMDPKCIKRPEKVLCWGDKANDFYQVGRVARCFPRGKFVFLVRDPRGAVSSLAKRMVAKETLGFNVPVAEEKLVEASISWRWMTLRMLSFKKRHPERAVLVRLEDFLSGPVETLNKLFVFILNRPMPEDMVRERLERIAYGSTNEPRDSGSGIRKEPIDRWRNFLSDGQVELINWLTGITARKVGYKIDEGPLTSERMRILMGVPSIKRRAVVVAKLLFLYMFEMAA